MAFAAKMILTICVLFACVFPAQLQADAMTLLTAADYSQFAYMEPDRRYSYGDDTQQVAELYLPETPPPHPVIVLAHGGCYYGSYDLRPISSIARALTDEGFAVWNIEYRRAGNGGDFPNMFLDVGAATDRLREIAEEQELDLQHVISIGHSAGGHLALWLAGRKRIATTSALYSADPLPIAGVIGLAPIADIADALERGMCGTALPVVMGSQLPTAEANLKDSSPVELLPLAVPQIHIVGSEDDLIRENLQRYVDAALDAGDDVELIVLEGAGHFELVAVDKPEWQQAVEAIQRLRTTIAGILQ